MKELKLLYSYDEWKNKTQDIEGLSEDSAQLLALSFNFNRTEEEEKEYKELSEKTYYQNILRKYTTLTYEITDMYNLLKYTHCDDARKELYESIGRKQCEIEIIKENFLK